MYSSILVRLSGLVLLLLFSVPLLAQQGYRINADSAHAIDSIRAANYSRDYGRTIWLEGGPELQQQLRAAGVSFEHFPEAGRIQVHHWRFDPTETTALSEAAPRDSQGRGLGLVQFRGPLTPANLDGLRNAGLEPLQYYPHNTYLVWGTHSALDSARQMAHVRFAGDFSPELRIHPDLARLDGMIRNINVHFVNTGNIESVLVALDAMGAEVLDAWKAQPDGRLWDAKIALHAADLDLLRNLPEMVSANFLSPEVFLDDESGAQVVAGNLDASNIPAPGYADWLDLVGLDGAGVIWATTDSGVWYGHGDYADRIVGGTSYPGCTSVPNPGDERPTGGGHGTHVTGIFAGTGAGGFADGDGFLYGLGVAPAASIYAQNPICGTQSSWPPAGGWPVLSRDALQGGAIGSNNSWTSGEGTQHGYQNTERTYDFMVLDGNFESGELEPFMVVFSAGNSGFSGVTAPKEAKNVVVTGSTQTYRVSGNVDAISGFSSRGPAVDGRVLPTIAAPGETVSSAIKPSATSCTNVIGGTNGLYSFCSGTSMAAPHASGALILLSEWWRNGNGGEDFSPAMGKALLINSARAISTDGPNNNSGFGRVDLGPIVGSGLSFELWDQTEILTESGQQWSRQVGVVDPAQPLKITLVWSDAPGAIGANPAMVNDLDLVVENDGQTWLGNVTSGQYSVPGGSPDRLNNIEQVWIENPGPTAVITVDAFQIAGSVLLDQPDVTTAQHFALVCQNCAETPDYSLTLDPAALQACVPEVLQSEVIVGNILGFDDPVSLSLSGVPAGVDASLSDNLVTPPDSVTLTLDVDAGAASGHYPIEVIGDSTTGQQSRILDLDLFTANPDGPDLELPADGAIAQPVDVVFSWNPASQALEYQFEIALDADFNDVVYTQVTADTSLQAQGLDTSQTYYWRVTAINACGQTQSATYTLTTESLPGDCPIGTTTASLMMEDFDGGTLPSGWTTAGSSGAVTWVASTAQTHSGSHSMFAQNIASVSDQRLATPAISLPDDAVSLFLNFQNWQHIESRAGGCWDGGILEISTNDGGSWDQVSDTHILVRDYDGPIGTGWSNPLEGQPAWCGDPRDFWERYTVDLSNWAGQDVNFRFRFGTDSLVSRVGWYVDSVEVRACESLPTLSLSTNSLDFDSIRVGTTAGPLTVTAENTGLADLVIADVGPITGSDAANFAIVSNTCENETLAPAATCEVEIEFTPDDRATFAGMLDFNSNAASSPDTVDLAGTGIAPVMVLSTELIDFSVVPPGTTSAPMTLTVTNNGDDDLNVSGLDNLGAPFSLIGGSCDAPAFNLPMGQDCTLEFEFNPVDSDAAMQTVTIDSDSFGGTSQFILQGNTEPPSMGLAIDSIDFGAIVIGQSGNATLTIENTGAGTLEIDDTIGPAAPFGISGGTCDPAPFTLGAGAGCTIEFEFSPVAAGPFADQMTLISNADTSPDTVELVGGGVPDDVFEDRFEQAPSEP